MFYSRVNFVFGSMHHPLANELAREVCGQGLLGDIPGRSAQPPPRLAWLLHRLHYRLSQRPR